MNGGLCLCLSAPPRPPATPILITTLQQVPPGTEGAVSVEGTVAGIVGSAVLALFGLLFGLITPSRPL